MSWACWLAFPLLVTALACVGTWWRSRPPAAPATDEAMRRHGDFLAALDRRARHPALAPGRTSFDDQRG